MNTIYWNGLWIVHATKIPSSHELLMDYPCECEVCVTWTIHEPFQQIVFMNYSWSALGHLMFTDISWTVHELFCELFMIYSCICFIKRTWIFHEKVHENVALNDAWAYHELFQKTIKVHDVHKLSSCWCPWMFTNCSWKFITSESKIFDL